MLTLIPYAYYASKKSCTDTGAAVFSFAVCLSFLILFVNFYRKSYTRSGAKGKATAIKNAEQVVKASGSPKASPKVAGGRKSKPARKTPRKKQD